MLSSILQLTSFFSRRVAKNNFYFKRLLKEYQGQQSLSRSQLLEHQKDLLIKLVHRAYHHSVFYRRLYDQHGIQITSIKDTRDVHQLPVITKKDIKDNIDKIWIGTKLFAKKSYTSGTSGSPLTVYRNASSVIKEEAYIWRQRIHFGHRYGMKAVSLRGDLDRTQFRAYDPFSNTMFLSSFMLNHETAQKYYKVISKFRPNAIYAYPSSAEILANFLLEKNTFLHVPLIFTSSETLYDFQREKIEKAFGARVVDWYGNAERTIALEENKGGTYRELPLYSYNEYKENHVLTTGLINFNFPLIRYKIDDSIEVGSEVGVVKSIRGRNDDIVLLPDGTQVGRLGSVFKGLKEIHFAQIIQNEIDRLYINVVPIGSLGQTIIQQIEKNIRQRVGNGVQIVYQKIKEEDLIKSARGKYKLVINNLEDSVIKTHRHQSKTAST